MKHDILFRIETKTREWENHKKGPETQLEVVIWHGPGTHFTYANGWGTLHVELCLWHNWRIFKYYSRDNMFRHLWLWRYGTKWQWKWDKMRNKKTRRIVWVRKELDWDDIETTDDDEDELPMIFQPGT